MSKSFYQEQNYDALLKIFGFSLIFYSSSKTKMMKFMQRFINCFLTEFLIQRSADKIQVGV